MRYRFDTLNAAWGLVASVRTFVSRRRRLAAFALALGLAVGGGLWAWLPPEPRASWPIAGGGLFFSADGRLLATIEHIFAPQKPRYDGRRGGGDLDGPEACKIHVYDVASGRETAVMTWEKAEVRSLAFPPDGSRVAALGVWRKEIREWETATGRELMRVSHEDLTALKLFPSQVAYSTVGTLFAVVRPENGNWILWNCQSREPVAALTHGDEFAPNDVVLHSFLLADIGKKTLKVWRLDTGELTGEFHWGYPGFRTPRDITLSRDGKLLLGGSRDGVQIWDAGGGYRQISPLNAESNLALSPDNCLLAALSWNDPRTPTTSFLTWLGLMNLPSRWTRLTLYDLSNGSELGYFPRGIEARFSSDGQTLAVQCDDQTIQFWDLPLRRPGGKIVGWAVFAAVFFFLAGCLFKKRHDAKRAASV